MLRLGRLHLALSFLAHVLLALLVWLTLRGSPNPAGPKRDSRYPRFVPGQGMGHLPVLVRSSSFKAKGAASRPRASAGQRCPCVQNRAETAPRSESTPRVEQKEASQNRANRFPGAAGQTTAFFQIPTAGKTIVYVIDRSSSMGRHGYLTLAKAS